MRLAVLLQPRNNPTGQLRKIIHRQLLKRHEHFVHDGAEHLELDVVAEPRLGPTRTLLLLLEHVLVVLLDDPQCHHLLLERGLLLVLLLLVLVQEADVIDRLLQHGSLAQLVTGSVGLLAAGDQLLQRIVPLLDGVPALLLGLGVRLAAPFLVADAAASTGSATLAVVPGVLFVFCRRDGALYEIIETGEVDVLLLTGIMGRRGRRVGTSGAGTPRVHAAAVLLRRAARLHLHVHLVLDV